MKVLLPPFISVFFILILQVASAWLQGRVDWEIVNPASNHFGWYLSSLQSVVLSWIWPSAFLVSYTCRSDLVRSFFIFVVLILFFHGAPSESLWEVGLYTQEERWFIGLTTWYRSLFIDTSFALLALVATKRPYLLSILIPVAALRVFL